MIIFKNISTVTGQRIDLELDSSLNQAIPAESLLVLPSVIDPHVHFRTPGMEYKEDWRTGAKAAIRGGCTMVFDMPNTKPPTITAELLKEKKQLLDRQLREADIPLHYQLFFGADKAHLNEIPTVRDQVVGIKVFMGCSTGNLVIDDDASLSAVFDIAAQNNMIVAVHAEDEHMLHERKAKFNGAQPYHAHSEIRNVEVATTAVAKAIELTRRYGTRLYVLHVSTAEEVALIKTAKQDNLPVYAETTPHHLFFDLSAYDSLQGKAVVNPPLRDKKNHPILFNAIKDKIIDTIGSDHAPHTLEEKSQAYGQCPSGMPGIEFMLPLLLNAYHQGLISLRDIINVTSERACDIFDITSHDDYVIIDLNKVKTITETHSKCAWSPYMGLTLQGWPIYTVLRGKLYAAG